MHVPKTGTLVAIVLLLVAAFVAWQWRYSPFFAQLFGATHEGQLISQVHYQCDEEKTMDVALYAGAQSATPTGSATVVLSDGRTLELAQTVSASGVRYANKDESFVFWDKGNGALVLEDNTEKSYLNCIRVADDDNLPQVYASGQEGFSLRYPAHYIGDETYVYEQLGPNKEINGVKFSIDPAVAQGTNLSSDSYVSVEQLPDTPACSATKFLDSVTASNLAEGTTVYSYASSTGAAAGNRYEEQVFALPGTNPCVAVRYYIHYGAIENYPEGTVSEFNHDALVGQFDSIRKTLVIVQ